MKSPIKKCVVYLGSLDTLNRKKFTLHKPRLLDYENIRTENILLSRRAKYKCRYCELRFVYDEALTKHVSEVHIIDCQTFDDHDEDTALLDVKCKICRKIFYEHRDLLKHIRNFHAKESEKITSRTNDSDTDNQNITKKKLSIEKITSKMIQDKLDEFGKEDEEKNQAHDNISNSVNEDNSNEQKTKKPSNVNLININPTRNSLPVAQNSNVDSNKIIDVNVPTSTLNDNVLKLPSTPVPIIKTTATDVVKSPSYYIIVNPNKQRGNETIQQQNNSSAQKPLREVVAVMTNLVQNDSQIQPQTLAQVLTSAISARVISPQKEQSRKVTETQENRTNVETEVEQTRNDAATSSTACSLTAKQSASTMYRCQKCKLNLNSISEMMSHFKNCNIDK